MARSCLFQGWTFLFTEFLRVLAAGMETAARRQIRRVPYLARQHDTFIPDRGIRHRDGGQQSLCVRVPGMIE